MGPWDGVDVDSDGGELLDWLWDYPERYDVGIADEPLVADGGVGASLTGVRKHLRRPGGAVLVGPPAEALIDERPTVAMDPIDSFGYDEDDSEYPPTGPVAVRRRRFSTRDLAAAAAVVLVVAAGVGVGYTLFKGKSATNSTKPNNLAIGSPSTTLANPSVIPSVDTTPTSSDTTTSIPVTTVSPSSSVPGVIPAASTTTTTTRHCTVNCTTTTVPRTTTTTATTVPRTTTVPAATTTTPTTNKIVVSTTALPGG